MVGRRYFLDSLVHSLLDHYLQKYMKILVTGGNGFIGSYVVKNLRNKGHEVLIFDHQRKDEPIFLGDVKNYSDVDEALKICDGFIHLAGVLGTQETVDQPLPAIETNILGSLNMFQAARRHQKKGVYIAVGNHFENNPYSISKTTAERFALMFNKEHGTQIAVVRAMNAYGAGQKQKPVRKIMPNFIIPALSGGKIEVYGDGEQVMDMIYVEDLAEILVRALLIDHGVYATVFEAGTGVPTTVNQIAVEVIKQVGRGTIDHLPMRPGETPGVRVLANPETLHPILFDSSLFTTLADGLTKTIPFYQDHYEQ